MEITLVIPASNEVIQRETLRFRTEIERLKGEINVLNHAIAHY